MLARPADERRRRWRVRGESGAEGLLLLFDAPVAHAARALRSVLHPALPALYAAGSRPVPHLVIDPAPGQPLFDAADRLYPARVPEVLAHVADGLRALHEAGHALGRLGVGGVVVGTREVRITGFGPSCRPAERGGTEADEAALARLAGFLCRRQEIRTGLPAELVAWLLDLSRRPRPPARVVEELERWGYPPPAPTGVDVLRRAAGAPPPPGRTQEAVEGLLREGGIACLHAREPGARLGVLRVALEALRGTGRRIARVAPEEAPGAAIRQVLLHPALGGGAAGVRGARDATRALLAHPGLRELVVVAEDADRIDPASASALEAAARQGGLCVLAVSREPLAWATRNVPAAVLRPADVRRWVDALLVHPVDPALHDAPCLRGDDLTPEQVAATLARAVDAGALRLEGGRWRLRDPRPCRAGVEAPPPRAGASTVEVALFLAGGGPRLEELARVAGVPPAEARAAVDRLAREGRAFVARGRARWVGPPPPAPADREAACAAIERARAAGLLDLVRLGTYLVRIGQPDLVARFGRRVVDAASGADPQEAARIADELWSVAPLPELAPARLRAMVAAGRGPEAVAEATAWLAGRELGPAEREAWATVLLVQVDWTHEPAAVLEAVAELGRRGVPLPPGARAARARALLLCGEGRAAAAAAREALALEDVRADADASLHLAATLALALARADRVDAALRSLYEVPPSLGAGRAERAHLEALRGLLLHHAGRFAEAREALERATRSHVAIGALDQARLLLYSGLLGWWSGDLERALTDWGSALSGFDRLDAPRHQLAALLLLAEACRETAQFERARECAERAMALASAHGLAWGEARAGLALALLCSATADWHGATRWLQRAQAIAERVRVAPLLTRIARVRAEIAVSRDMPSAPQQVRVARALATPDTEAEERARIDALYALVLVRAGEWEAARGLLHSARRGLADPAARRVSAEVELRAAECLCALGRPEEAQALALEVRLDAEEQGRLLLRERADALLARIRADAGGLLAVEALSALLAGRRDTLRAEERAADDALQLLGRLLGARHAWYFELDERGRRPRPVARWSVPEATEVAPPHELVRQALAAGGPVSLHERAGGHEQTMRCVPVALSHRPLGLVVAEWASPPPAGADALLQLGGVLAATAVRLAGAARARARLERLLRDATDEIEQPANAIATIARSEAPAAPPEQREAFEDVAIAADRLRSVVQRLRRPPPAREDGGSSAG